MNKMTDHPASNRSSTFHKNLEAFLQYEFLNQRTFADELGVDYKWMRRLCHRGLERVDRRTQKDLERITDRYGLQISDLWREQTTENFSPIQDQVLIKWTGSKRLQAEEIISRFPQKIETYYEPFVGGGSVLYRLLKSDIKVNRYRCSDTCKPLIGLWRMVKENPRKLVLRYDEMWRKLQKEGASFYQSVRDEFNDSQCPALFFFLLRTCRNGLIRFNQQGNFTAAFHHGRGGMKPDTVRRIILDWSNLLRQYDVRFYWRNYQRIQASEGDLLYLDPPYRISPRFVLYNGPFDFETFFCWLRKQSSDYLLSLNGFSGEEDRRVDVPTDLYDEHLLIDSGSSSLARMNGNAGGDLRDSLYISRK
ncbi:Dam family site-specific DNA-(adenine-N6)-methyltransferase [Gimesia chilikensis]|uniref:site-specific DNA-methyltransferase (adenine-specific) n=1 Tax=Gimesia chilikensis TaxID=2605989 RepID=A0A517PYK4_9PLAN|nr:Dam family site-specific DNA-(adenine-N6)-methyltransferase [Gimesia chilikensis]QDT24444.1 DNA adenine methylase [Gimesia chilikensis]